jgi:hypothetical protein
MKKIKYFFRKKTMIIPIGQNENKIDLNFRSINSVFPEKQTEKLPKVI